MQHIQQVTLSIENANKAHKVELDPAMWAFIVKAINYPELRFDKETDVIHIDGYVPFTELAKEWINGIADGSFDVRKCELCIAYFDVDKEDGIYGKPEDFEEYICMPCAEKMTAFDYYKRFIERSM